MIGDPLCLLSIAFSCFVGTRLSLYFRRYQLISKTEQSFGKGPRLWAELHIVHAPYSFTIIAIDRELGNTTLIESCMYIYKTF